MTRYNKTAILGGIIAFSSGSTPRRGPEYPRADATQTLAIAVDVLQEILAELRRQANE